MNQAARPAPRHRRRLRPRLERLEARLPLSGADGLPSPDGSPGLAPGIGAADLSPAVPLTAQVTSPSPGSWLTGSPASVVITLSGPADPATVGSDVDIVGLAADDTPVSETLPNVVQLDPTGTVLTATLDGPLAPGHYEVLIVGGSNIADPNGNLLIPDGNPLNLGDFSIAVPGATLADAVDLGPIGSTPLQIPGLLDFRADPFAVSLYKITLPAGHFWRLGAEVSAQRDGGTLDSALALFDANCRPISTDEVGRLDDPYDPYLFAGLEPGTYYVGVSGAGNLPGLPGGYDPATGSAGSVLQPQAGGAFTLHLVADAADSPTRLQQFQVNWAAGTDASPTGLTLGFSGALRLSNQLAQLQSTLDTGIRVVDQAGRSWPVAATNYDEANARISYLFRDPLPAGLYTVRLPVWGGLVDLAGLPPVSPGQASGVLGKFLVGMNTEDQDPNNLGPLLPNAAEAGVTAGATLAPGQTASFDFVVVSPTIYSFQVQDPGDSLRIRLVDPNGYVTIVSGADGGANLRYLATGHYRLALTNTGQSPISAALLIKSSVKQELVLANGVGQGPGLSLRLIAPPPPSSDSQGQGQGPLGGVILADSTPTPPVPPSSPTPQPVVTPPPPTATLPPPTPTPSPTTGTPSTPAAPSAPSTGGAVRSASTSDPAPLTGPSPLAASPAATAPAPKGPAADTSIAEGPARAALPSSGYFLGLGGDLVSRPTGDRAAIVLPNEDRSALAASNGFGSLQAFAGGGDTTRPSYQGRTLPVRDRTARAAVLPRAGEAEPVAQAPDGAAEEIAERLGLMGSAMLGGFDRILPDARADIVDVADASTGPTPARAEAGPVPMLDDTSEGRADDEPARAVPLPHALIVLGVAAAAQSRGYLARRLRRWWAWLLGRAAVDFRSQGRGETRGITSTFPWSRFYRFVASAFLVRGSAGPN